MNERVGIITVQGGVVLAAPPNVMLWDWDNWEEADLEHKIEMFVSLMIGTPALGGPDEKLAMGVLEGAAQRVVALFVAHNEGS